ncbi:hypothetical protein CLOM_g13504 [Closterium sp. NIES-68]|nr:hypothetical protein CLOM_g13504 [Closterium sp. NIES-68]GJP78648.1 hypothetical protein CLOP_g8924 [Closterium sp. NIES-67]
MPLPPWMLPKRAAAASGPEPARGLGRAAATAAWMQQLEVSCALPAMLMLLLLVATRPAASVESQQANRLHHSNPQHQHQTPRSLSRLFPRAPSSPSSAWLPPWLQEGQRPQGRTLLGRREGDGRRGGKGEADGGRGGGADGYGNGEQHQGHAVLTAALVHHSAAHGCAGDHVTYHTRQRHRDMARMCAVFAPLSPGNDASTPAAPRVALPSVKAARVLQQTSAAAGAVPGIAAFDLGGRTIPYGLYYLNVSLSSPARSFSLVFDTGSDMLWVPCDCILCATDSSLVPLSPPYRPEDSLTAQPVTCSSPLCPSGRPNIGCGVAPNISRALPVHSNSSSPLPASSWPSPSDTCQYVIRYGDGSSTEGTLVTDVINLSVTQTGAGAVAARDETVAAATSSPSVPGGGQALVEGAVGKGSGVVSSRVVFGCGRLQSGSLINSPFSVDGLMGFGSGPRSVIRQLSSLPSPGASPPSSLTASAAQAAASPGAAAAGGSEQQQGAVVALAFSFCLDGGDTGGGHLALGRAQQPAHMQTAALWHIDKLPYHYINISSMSIGGRQVADADSLSAVNRSSLAGGTIIDSGTTFTALPPAVYNSLRDVVFSDPLLSAFADPTLGDCTLFPSNATLFDEVFPDLLISFGNATWAVPPTNYLFLGGFMPRTRMVLLCLAALPISSSRVAAIIGESWLQNFYILMDEERGLFGWHPLNCSTGQELFRTSLPKVGGPAIPPAAADSSAPSRGRGPESVLPPAEGRASAGDSSSTPQTKGATGTSIKMIKARLYRLVLLVLLMLVVWV